MTNLLRNTLLGSLVVASALSLAAPANAGQTVTASIASIMPEQRVLGLDDGKKFTVHTQVELDKFKMGDQVAVTFIEPQYIWRLMGFTGFATDVAPVTS